MSAQIEDRHSEPQFDGDQTLVSSFADDSVFAHRSLTPIEQSLLDEIEYISPAFSDVLKSISLTNLLSAHTFFAWRLGVSDRFIDEAVLPRVRDKGLVAVILPMFRQLWPSNLGQVTVEALSSAESTNLSRLLSAQQFLFMFDAHSQLDASRVLETIRALNYADPGLAAKRRIIVLAEVFGPFEPELATQLRILMRDGLSRGVVLWLHAQVVHIPRDYLDQFHNHIILLPSKAEVDILAETQSIPLETIERKGGRRNAAIVYGPCVEGTRSWAVIGLTDVSELETEVERHLLQELVEKFSRNHYDLLQSAADFVDPRSVPPDLRIAIERVKHQIAELQQKLASLSPS